MPIRPSFDEVLDALQEIAPLEMAADWDNTGLVVAPRRSGPLSRVLLTIDLSEAVVREAKSKKADLVVAYHPPIFHGWKRLDAADPKQRAALLAFAAGLPVYSPHTALDAAPGGVADWLAEGVAGGREPARLEPCGEGDFGRVVELKKAEPLGALLPRIKRFLGVRTLRLALLPQGLRQKVKRIGVAAGSGGSVLRGQRADLWLTGELSHHEALAAVAAGTAVALGEHSNTERGYLKTLARRLAAPFGRQLSVVVSASDADPFTLG